MHLEHGRDGDVGALAGEEKLDVDEALQKLADHDCRARAELG